HYSCSILTHTVRDKKITTIEGLEKADGTLHPVQQAVVDEQGFQCAFCMSGFMMATVGFLKTNPNPTRAELAHGISGNLCRCADYNKILNAMIGAATPLTEVVNNPLVKEKYPLLRQAAELVASPQIRNQGTIGGNVSQDTRCWYYRAGWTCYRAGGNICYADTPTAINREHAIF